MSQQQFDNNELFLNVGYNDVMSFQNQPNTSRYSEMNEVCLFFHKCFDDFHLQTYNSSRESSTFDEGASELNNSTMAASGGQANMMTNIQTPPGLFCFLCLCNFIWFIVDTPADQRQTLEQQQQQAALTALYGNMYNYNAMAYMATGGQPFYDPLSQYQQYINPQYQQQYQQFFTVGADGQQYAFYPTPEQLQQYYAQQYREQEQQVGVWFQFVL
jgi:hypothetical protein